MAVESAAPLVPKLFLAAYAQGADRVFLRSVAPESGLSYRETAAVFVRTVERLHALGLKPGDRALVYAEAIRPSIHFMLSCAFAGLVFVPLATSASPETARRLARQVGARVAFTTSTHRAPLNGLDLPILHDGQGEGALDLTPAPHPDDAARLRECCTGRTADEAYLILSTSGSTGIPKRPIRSHRAFTLAARHYQERLGLHAEPRERLLLCSSLSHGLGQMMLTLGLQLGAELCLTTAIEGAVALDEVRRLDPSLIGVHPRVLLSLARQHLEQGGAAEARFLGPALRRLRTGGSPIDPEWLRRLAAQGIDVGEWYGSSETSIVAITPFGQWRAGAIGPPCPGVELRLADDGEILVRSPTQMTAYDADDAQTRETLTADGFIRTGDLGWLTADGALCLIGRKHDLLNAPDGSNIAAAPLEERLLALPWVEQAVVVGDGRPFLAALIVARAAPDSTAADGFLDETLYPGGYARAHADLATLNAGLEAVERIRTCALFARRFALRLYAEVGQGKIRRDRHGLNAAYQERIEALYTPLLEALRSRLMPLIDGAWVTQAIYVAAALGVADQLDAEARPVDELAQRVGADPESLYRLLRALATLDLFTETAGRRFALTPLAALLRRDHPHSLRNRALLRGRPETYAVWGDLLDAVRTGRSGFESRFGRTRFDYFQSNPEAAAVFQAAMDDKTRAVAARLAADPSFAGLRRLVDVGGGHGRLLGAILQAWPGLRGVLFDRPEVIAGARPVLDALGVTARVELVGGDGFAEVPPADGYLLCNVLHDWSDADAERILRTIERAMMPEGRVVIVELSLPSSPNQPSPAAWLDLHMLVALGGRERAMEEMTALAERVGLRLRRSTQMPTPTPYSILEYVRA